DLVVVLVVGGDGVLVDQAGRDPGTDSGEGAPLRRTSIHDVRMAQVPTECLRRYTPRSEILRIVELDLALGHRVVVVLETPVHEFLIQDGLEFMIHLDDAAFPDGDFDVRHRYLPACRRTHPQARPEDGPHRPRPPFEWCLRETLRRPYA